ncbi:3-oxoacid CoA-transferase B subunit [Deinococcus metalli]|uniref:3-oxoacid CoA-transferase B subunit n=1 Tax=Deinococcus metalli TaxID=1141878 RepID=A0A7W8KC91_9DEIO|nr:CoA-transferase [Deinococcus metalli]MBB5375537.1 3-oxoacid CoA-transferase B subunit [Deinococcus metalli]GHF28530.1 hypothetical protein GCM10017781_00590 [Deinococcus metalli]
MHEAKTHDQPQRALAELHPGDVVNLGIGIPTLIADLITPGMQLNLHTENGTLGVGSAPYNGGALEHPVNAGTVPVTAVPGASYFDSADSFGMIRGGHVHVAVMGGLQVDAHANLANWAVPGKPLLGVGGAMDLASGARRLIVLMTHTDPDGTLKVVSKCTLPLSELALGSILDDIWATTGACRRSAPEPRVDRAALTRRVCPSPRRRCRGPC